MASTINLLAGAAAEVLPSPVGSSPNRPVAQRAENRGVPENSIPTQPGQDAAEETAQDNKYLLAILDRAQSAGLSNNTTLTFERDDNDGKMYLYIKDKRTGEEVVRIPKKLLDDAKSQPEPVRRVDVRI